MNTKKISWFLLFAFALSWIIALCIYLLHIKLTSVSGVILLVFYMYMPALSALIVQKFMYKESMVGSLKISFRINTFFYLALILPAVLVFLATFLGFILPGVSYSPDMAALYEKLEGSVSPEKMEQMQKMIDSLPFHPVWLSIVQGFIYGATINALAAFGEELGWRGFLIQEFRSIKFIKVSLVIGIIWGIWHTPIILMGHNYSEHPKWGVLFMIVFCTLYTFLINYFTIKAKSVIAASLMHGSINAFYGITFMISYGGSDLLTGMTGVAGFCILAIAIIVLFIYDKYISREGVMTRSVGESFDA